MSSSDCMATQCTQWPGGAKGIWPEHKLKQAEFNAHRNYCSPSLHYVSPFFLMTEQSGEKVLSLSHSSCFE